MAQITAWSLINLVMDLFHKEDLNNDNLLDMDEFSRFGHSMHDAADFYHIASRQFLDEDDSFEDFNPPVKAIPRRLRMISQEEWDCTQNPSSDGLTQDNCRPDNTQTKVTKQLINTKLSL